MYILQDDKQTYKVNKLIPDLNSQKCAKEKQFR